MSPSGPNLNNKEHNRASEKKNSRTHNKKTNRNQSKEKPVSSRSVETPKNAVCLEPVGTDPVSNVATVDASKEEQDEDEQICFICAEGITYSCVLPCNHRMCHVCALRLRALYKTKECTFCKTEWDTVLITKDHEIDIHDVDLAKLPFQDEKLGIVYSDEHAQEESNLLLQFNCPEDACDITCKGWFDLKLHAKVKHHKFFCDLCVKNKKVFTHEHTLFSKKGLTKHNEVGDQGSDLEITGFKGHPKCEFCNTHFYDDDELFKHCREKHERCYICDQVAGRPTHQYFKNYDSLERHFEKDHYICRERECLERKFVVFGTEIDLKAHQLDEHPHNFTQRELREARRIIPQFSYDPPGASGRNRRERTSSTPSEQSTSVNETANSLSNLHLSRGEIAHLRQEEYVREQQARHRDFGFTLSNPAPTSARPATSTRTISRGKTRTLRNEDFPSLAEVANQNSSSAPSVPVSAPRLSGKSASRNHVPSPPKGTKSPMASSEQAQHQQVIDRMQKLTNYDDHKINDFKFAVSSFRGNVMPAREAVARITKLVAKPHEQLSGVFNQIANLLENKEKSRELLEAWQEWKILNAKDDTRIGTTNSNLLRLKRSNRTAAQTASVWNRIERAAAHDGPSLSAPSSSINLANITSRPTNSSAANTPSWGVRKARASALNARSEEDFPALPPSTSKRISVQLGKKQARPVDSWGSTPNTSSNRNSNTMGVSKKKNGKKQTVLFHIG
ncbi:ubiquitin-protein ligase E3 involved in rescue of stalled ribosomes Hel2 [Schizosaccharomyces pombe]|uniref:E3 ubiquitin-protein ligase hel2 n=1 Tax=Schizosaccharomyces pombe (strain 972 / ATCC 24843) TaxID=284812 RepID=HEL2_SCHPO|nr:putative ubiquitin-protein ligase E3 [Schizosaccharomyces pombe]Q76PD2.2 RecName: Full=E3 ubiquitin-protein ligase hel2; AltName: Full=Histone E3 ligase 2; AltName: Full=RING-type E3 ubiquitin transferase hel2 [Schizosaccharomyces pombe 972h-]CAA20857.2 ubiquitin-protein ligase E3 (predicted) [Schizosaccharomyces pombe]|eukprot:NP_588346.2 putative ubiquitin-protein ligase E3 [Schizosaccharomyces pombe]